MARKHPKPIRAKVQPGHPFFEIIERAYEAFDVPKPDSTDVCVGCCMEADIEADFFNPPIRELPLHYLQDWFFAAYDPEGVSKRTWSYLLPRILEVLAVDEEPANVGLEVSLNRFRTGDKDLWPSQQWAVLDDFQRAYLDREIKRIGGECLDDAICMFGLAGWPLNELFEQVSAQSDRILAERFFSDWCVGRPSIWITAFWEQPGNTEAFNFYTSRDLYERMEALALDEGTDPELAEKALSVASVIQSNADWAQPG